MFVHRASLVTLALLGTVAFADAPIGLNGLQKVEGSRVDLAYERPGANWAKFKTVQIQPLVVPAGMRTAEDLELNDEDVSALQTLYAETMRQEFYKQGFPVVEAASADTVVISAEITDLIAPNALGPQRSGSIAVKGFLTDGATNTVVAAASDRKFANRVFPEDTRETNLIQVRDALANWAHVLAADLRTRVDAPTDIDYWSCLNERKNCPKDITPR